MIPQYPEFAPISLDDKSTLEAYWREHPPLASEYTFTNLHAWRGVYHYQLARFNDGFLILKVHQDHLACLQPQVPDRQTEAIAVCFAYLREHGQEPVIQRVGEDFIAHLSRPEIGMRLEENRDDFDYVYRVDELITLKGEKFHDKKNLLNQFHAHNTYRYLPLIPAMVPECLSYMHEWCEERNCEQVEGLLHETCAGVQMLEHFPALSAVGGVIEVEGKIVALSVGEALNPETFVIHIEKADNRYTGLYQTINQEFLQHAAANYRYVNREQDLGIPGLRKAKLSYNPVRMVKKYTIRLA